MIDGDMVECDDAPEMDQGDYGRQSKAALETLLPAGALAAVELDVQERDRYGRLLAVLYAPDGTMINEALVAASYAVVSVYAPNVRYVERIRAGGGTRRRTRAVVRTGVPLPAAGPPYGTVRIRRPTMLHVIFRKARESFLVSLACLAIPSLAAAQRPDSADVRQTVEAFYAAFNSHGWDTAAIFTTDDWVHINPYGGWTRGREAVLAELRQVHETFLRGVTDTPDSIVVKFAHPETAIVTVTSRVSRYVLPNGEVHDDEKQIRTFVVVKRAGTWLIMHDQNTVRR